MNRKVLIAGMLGNGLEWYDYALYGHMAIIFSKLFFPSGDASESLILTYLTFAAGFLSRPLGAIVFGRIGDTYGRKRALVLSMMLMAIPTGCIGLLPTYETIGLAAPILLLVIRLLQGFSLGGAYSGSISYIVEHAPPDQRSRIGSVIKMSLVVGFLLGSTVSTLVASLLPQEAFESWGWRIPFFIGVGIGIVGHYIRHHGEESPVYTAAKDEGRLSPRPVRDTLFRHPEKLIRMFVVYLFVTIPFYLIGIYMIAFSVKHLGLSEGKALLINAIAMLGMFVTIYPAARLGDRVGRRPVLLSAILAMLLFAYPAFMLMETKQFAAIALAQTGMAMILGWYLAPIPAVLVEAFPTSIRYTGMSLAYNICAIIGGFTPALAEKLISSTGNPNAIALLLLASGVASFVAIYSYKDRWREPLPEC